MKPEAILKTTAAAEASFSGAMAAAGEVAVAAVGMVAVEGAVGDEADGKGFGFPRAELRAEFIFLFFRGYECQLASFNRAIL